MIPAASPSQSRGIVHNDDPAVRHALQPAATSGDNPITATFHEHCRLVDPSTSHAAHVVTWLKSVGDRLLTSGEVALRAKVTYHLSDSPELSAFVAHVGDDARVVVSKGLLQKLIKNEDMLAAILGHELMHVHFRERFQESGERLAVTKVEEYVADVASISTWMIKAGYAPHQAVAVFDSLKEQTSPSGKNGERLLRPWIAFNDEHGLLENRAQAINALIAKEIKERGSVPVDVTPLTGEIKAAVAQCVHVTHVEGIKRDPAYLQATSLEKQKRLLDEIRDTSAATRHRIPELADEFRTVLKKGSVTAATVEDVYNALKENKLGDKRNFLELACREAQRQGRQGVVPGELRELAKVVRDFVTGRTDADIFNGAKKLLEFHTEWNGVDPGVRLALTSSFPSPSTSEEEAAPWERHLHLARTMMERGHPDLLYALWMTGAYDIRLLPMASSEALQKFSEFAQLVPVKQSPNFTLSPSGSWERASAVESVLSGEGDMRSRYKEFVDAAIAERRHRKAVSNHEISADLARYSSIEQVPAELLARNLEGALSFFAESIAHPSQTTFHPSNRRGAIAQPEWSEAQDEDELSSGVSDELAKHYDHAVALRKKFEAMLSLQDPELRREASEKIRAFYLKSDGPCYATLIGFHPEDEISRESACRHPLTLFAAQCPALAAHERAEFLRGLEHRLSSSEWTKAYFAGYTFADDREKLRHLQSVSVHQRSSQDLGAELLVGIFNKLRIGQESIVPIIAEHKEFFPAIRQVGDDERQLILDHIEAPQSWDAPLDQLVDVFWALEQAKLFPSAPSTLREVLREKIIQGIVAIQDPVERQLMAERVLLSPLEDSKRLSDAIRVGNGLQPGAQQHDFASKRDEAISQSAALLSLKDPVVRGAVTDVWSGAIREQMSARYGGPLEGRDDNTAPYIQAARPQLDDIVGRLRRRLPVQERRDMLGALANELELQETLAYRLRDGIVEHNRSGVMDAHEYFRSAEAGFEFLNQDPERRTAVVKFLSQPLTLENLTNFARRVDISRSREIHAVTDTLDTMEEGYQKERDNTEDRIQRLTYFADPDRWLGTRFEVLEGHLKHCRDLSETFSGDTLVELVGDAIPDVVTQEDRERILGEIDTDRDVLPFEEASQIATRAGEQLLAAYVTGLSAEQVTFNEVLNRALTEVEGALPTQPVDVLRRKVLHQLASLPAYTFMETLEDKLASARDAKSLGTTIRRAIEGLPKSFDRERAKGEVESKKSTKRVLQSITSAQRAAQSEREALVPQLSVFHGEVRKFLEQMPDIVHAKDSPILHRVAALSTNELLDYLNESVESELSEELEAIRGEMIRKADTLSEGLPALKERVERMLSVRSEIEGRLPDLKKVPVPVIAVIEEASANLGADDALSGEFFMEEFSKLYPKKRRASEIAVTPLEEQHARQLYELFWSQSAEIRSVALKLLILPPEAEYQDRRSGKDSHFKQAFDFVADQIFPAHMRYGTESRKILRIFLEETDASLRGFMLAALMAASEKIAGAPEEYSAGKRLAMILSMLGPAEKKLGQAINSHPSTPEDLRSDTKSIKSMSDPLPRWELLARIREAMPNEYADVALPRVGKTLGAASYYIAVDCGDSVLSILRPHARSLARSGLDRMHSIAIRLSNDQQMKHVAGPFIESIQQAREMIDLETDHQKGVIQQENAWRRYDGLSVMVEGERFDFTTAAWKACGPEFRHQEKVKGEHFLDMIEQAEVGDPFLRRVALAHLTAELRNIVSGDTFDHDRHGSQSKIQRGATTHSIGLFDHGCMALQPPTKEEKQELASILCNLVQGYIKGETGILQRAHEIIREKRERDGRIPSYLVSVERALLALNDFMRFDAKGESTLLKKSDLGNALAAVFKTGQVDPVFASTIASHFGGSGASMFVKLLSPQQLCAKIADKLEEQIGSKASISIQQRAPHPKPTIIEFDTPRSKGAAAA